MDKMGAQGEQIRAKIDELSARAKEATADARIAIEQEIERLQSKL